jgi:hypothetical protein
VDSPEESASLLEGYDTRKREGAMLPSSTSSPGLVASSRRGSAKLVPSGSGVRPLLWSLVLPATIGALSLVTPPYWHPEHENADDASSQAGWGPDALSVWVPLPAKMVDSWTLLQDLFPANQVRDDDDACLHVYIG